MSSLPFQVYNRTKQVVREMAELRQFEQQGLDAVNTILPESVVGRLSSMQRVDTMIEQTLDLPAVVITFLGWVNDVNIGTLHQDDGLIRLSIQIVDREESMTDRGVESYMYWANLIRERLQDNPYERIDDVLGHVYLTHVQDMEPPEQDRWVLFNETRYHMMLHCYTRCRRDRTQQPWAVS